MTDVPPLDWTALVVEARRRRVRDKLTQGGHANLAGVSRDTIRSFDHFEKTITLEKALAILKVVGLAADENIGSGQADDFISRYLVRWRTLVESLPAGDPARLEHGYYFVSYVLEGSLDPVLTTTPETWFKILDSIPRVSGWSPFRISKKRALQPVIDNEEIECWLGRSAAREDKVYIDAPHLDFWRVSPHGAFFTLRGYQEDGADSTNPGTFLDIGLPFWRVGDVVDHARLLISEIRKRNAGQVANVRFAARWTGLSGRVLADWSNPTRSLAQPGRYRSRLDDVRASAEADPAALGLYPESVLKTLVRPLYQAFDFVDPDAIEEILAERAVKLEREGWGDRRRFLDQ